MAEKKKFTILLDEAESQLLDSIQAELNLTTRADVFRQLLQIYFRYVDYMNQIKSLKAEILSYKNKYLRLEDAISVLLEIGIKKEQK